MSNVAAITTLKSLFSVIIVSLASFSTFNIFASDDLRGWTKSGQNLNRYRTGYEEVATENGEKEAVYIKASRGNRMTYATLMKSVNLEQHRGKRIQMLTKIKTKRADSVAAWVKIDGNEATLAMDNMANRRLTGTQDWTEASIVIDIPEEAISMTFGFLMRGKGYAWFESPQLQFVGQDVATTNITVDANGKPLNFNENQIVIYKRKVIKRTERDNSTISP